VSDTAAEACVTVLERAMRGALVDLAVAGRHAGVSRRDRATRWHVEEARRRLTEALDLVERVKRIEATR
jgi:hypothetical protein